MTRTAAPVMTTKPAKGFIGTLARDLPASLVVFLVALPLCMGIAVASGLPPEKGILTGIIGGVVVGFLAGSPLQVSGPAAGLAVIVFDLVRQQGVGALGPILLLAGLIQIAAGTVRLGGWFRAVSPAVVHGMLAGIGVLIVAGQVHVLLDNKPLPDGLGNLMAIPAAYAGLLPFDGKAPQMALMVGLVTIGCMIGWEKLRPKRLRLVPGALVGVAAGTILAAVAALPIKFVAVPDSFLGGIGVIDLGILATPAVFGLLPTALAVAFIASAETLLSAAAVDRMHDGPRTQYNRELSAQGLGNLLCGLLGALPMTGVIVRSSANVQAGAVSRMSAILHGVWLLALVVAAPWLLRLVPMAALAGVLVVTGYRLVSLQHVRHLFDRYGILPAIIWAVTFVTVVSTDLLTGVLVGLGLVVLETIPHLTRLRLRVRHRSLGDGITEVRLAGRATFLMLPQLQKALDEVPPTPVLRVRSKALRHIDHTCMEALSEWAAARRRQGSEVEIVSDAEPRLARTLAFAA